MLWLAIGTLALWASLWTAAGWLLGSSPGPGPWTATLRPELIDAQAFPGGISAAALSGVALREGLQPLPAEVRERYGRDTLAFEVDVSAPAPATPRTGLLEVRDGDSTLQLAVGEHSGALRFASIGGEDVRLVELHILLTGAGVPSPRQDGNDQPADDEHDSHGP